MPVTQNGVVMLMSENRKPKIGREGQENKKPNIYMYPETQVSSLNAINVVSRCDDCLV